MSTENRKYARQCVQDELDRQAKNRAWLATKADVDPKTLRSFLNGDRWPQRETRQGIARALGWLSDEIDHIETTGHHRGEVTYVDRETGETWKRTVATDAQSSELTRAYTDSIKLAQIVFNDYPSIVELAEEQVRLSTDLWTAAMAIARSQVEGGDGDAENSRGSAPTRTQADYGLVADEDDVTIEDEQEQTEQST